MYNELLIGAVSGGAAGAIITFFAHIAPAFGAGNFIKDLDRPNIMGRELSRREAHLLGILVHLCLSILFGMGFGYAVSEQWFAGFNLVPLLIYSIIVTLVSGLAIMPWEGLGFFGRKHDSWFIIDTLLTNFGWALLVFLLAGLWTS